MSVDEIPTASEDAISSSLIQQSNWLLPILLSSLGLVGLLGILALCARVQLAKYAGNLERIVEERTSSLRASEERYRTLVEHAPETLLVLDAQSGYPVDANPNAMKFFGLTQEQLLRRNIFTFTPPLQSDGRLSDPLFRAKMKDALDWKIAIFEWIFINSAKEEIPCEVKLVRLPSEQQSLIRCSIQDIRQRKQSEQERLHHIWHVESLNKISEAIEQTHDLDTMMKKVIDRILEIYDCDRAALMHPCEIGTPYFTVPVESTKPEYPGLMNLKKELKNSPTYDYMIEKLLVSDEPVTFGPEHPLPGSESFNREHHILSRLCIAVHPKVGSPWILMLHQCSYTREWTVEEKKLLQKISSRVADALTHFIYYHNLRRSEERHRTVVNQVRDIIFQMDEDGVWTFLNPAWEKVTGFEIEKTLGTNFINYIHPGDRQKSQISIFQMIEGIRDSMQMECRLQTTKNEYRTVELIAYRHESDEVSRINLSGTINDITERQRSEKERQALQRLSQRLTGPLSARGLGIVVASESRKLFEHDAFLLSLIDHSMKVATGVYAQDTIEDEKEPVEVQIDRRSTFQEWPRDVIGGDPILINRDDENDPPFLSTFGAHTRRSRSLMYAPIRWQNQTLGILSIQSYRAHQYKQRDLNLLLTFADQCGGALKRVATEQENIRLEEQLRQSQKMEAIGTLAGGVAHDFNNLLTVISGNCSLLLAKTPQDSPLYRHVNDIRKASDRAAALTKQLLAFSRKQSLQTHVINLNKVIQDLFSVMSGLIDENIQINLQLDPDLGNIKADISQMEQVILNLVVNARDAMPNGGVIEIETRNARVDKDSHQSVQLQGQYILLEIRDNGVGIDPLILPQIFNPFFTTKEQGKGTGLGLSTVYGIVKNCFGHVQVSSQIDGGTHIQVYIPLVNLPQDPEREQRDPVHLYHGSETILVVEDEETVRTIIRDILTMKGYTILSASDGEEATQIIQQYPGHIELLITDLVMPKLNGMELAQKFLDIQEDLKILFISGYSKQSILGSAPSGETIPFLQKPFSPEDLLHKVREMLNSAASPPLIGPVKL